MAGCLGVPSANMEQTAKGYIGRNAYTSDPDRVINRGQDLTSTFQLSVYSPIRPTGNATLVKEYEFDPNTITLITQTENSMHISSETKNSNIVNEINKNTFAMKKSENKLGLYSLDGSKCYTFEDDKVICWDVKAWKQIWCDSIDYPCALMVYNSKLLVMHKGLTLLEPDTGKTIWSISGYYPSDFESIGFTHDKLIYKSISMSVSVVDQSKNAVFNVMPRDCNNATFINGYLWVTTRKNVCVKVDPETGEIIDSFYLFDYLTKDSLSMREGWIESFGSRILALGTFSSAIIDPNNPKDNISGLYRTLEIFGTYLPYENQYIIRMDGKVYLDYEHSISGLDNNDKILAYDKNLLLTSNNGKLRLYKVE